MKKKTKLSFREFETFKSEKEKELLNWFFVGDLFFLLATLILMFVSEGIFKLGILTWPHYWILVAGNLLFFSYFVFSLRKNFKTWLLKYLLAVYVPLLISGWIYFTDPKYTKILFTSPLTLIILIAGLLFYNFKALLLSVFATAVYLGLLLFHYSKIGLPFPAYEIYLIYMFLFMTAVISFPLIQRTKLFLIELLEKRKEAEESKSVLEIKVKARTKELGELNKTLEERIKQRTKQLQQRVNQLERFQKLTIGRELKMVELKKEIEELKKEKEN